jgi:DNA-binding SARP family transcriptional activator
MNDEPFLTLQLLGSFQMTGGGQPIAGLNQARLRELLAYLVLRRGAPVARSSLAFLFWPDSTDKQALTNGRHLYHRLRQAIPDAGRFLAADDLTVQWRNDSGCRVDVLAFEAALARPTSPRGRSS